MNLKIGKEGRVEQKIVNLLSFLHFFFFASNLVEQDEKTNFQEN